MKMIELKNEVLEIEDCPSCVANYKNQRNGRYHCCFTYQEIDGDILNSEVNKDCPLKDYVEETKINKIRIGQKGSYSIFSSITVVDFDEETVTLQDRFGNNKKVYKSLFNKYFVSEEAK